VVNPGPAVGVLAQLLALALLVPLAGLGAAGFVAGAAYGLALGALLAVAYRRAGTARPSPADVVTLGRAVLVGCVTALVVDSAAGRPAVLTLVVAAVALALDLLDGQVARRTGTVSDLGARFDMEVDAFLILVLSVVAARWLGWWVLAGGAMRYAFIAAGRLRPWLRRPVPSSMVGKVVAAVQGVTLLVVGSRLLPRPLSLAAAAVALALLAWSFGRSTWWLVRRRTAA
jgi:phosphatidylglycerophosphate synthase